MKMLSIKFKGRVSVIEKLKVVNKVFDIIGVNSRKEIIFSDYTFSRVEESESIEWKDEILENNIIDKLSNEHYITITGNTPVGDIRAEINPNTARKNVFNCSHIDISLENDLLLYDIFKENEKINSLKHYFDKKQKNKISEFYFVDLKQTPNCYSDIKSRLYNKAYDDIDFSNLLLKCTKFIGRPSNRLDGKNIRIACLNYTNRIFQEKHQYFIQGVISSNHLNIRCSAGSFEFYGDDIPVFIDLIIENLEKYIESIDQKKIYDVEFDKLLEGLTKIKK
jgi:hypothetical protein